jgi:glycerophosphoryl diester phosphodiesterase
MMNVFWPGRLRWLKMLAFIGLSLLPAACGSPTAAVPPGTRPPLVIGHAGSGFLTPINPFNPLPPNSLASLEQALARGADGLEIDVQLSQDSVVMLYHDATLESMTAGQGCVSGWTAAALRQLPYRAGWLYDQFQQERLLTLEDLLQHLQRQPRRPYLHFDLHHKDICHPKAPYKRAPALVRALARDLRRYDWPPARLLVLTTHQPTLALLRRELPDVPLGLEITENFAAGLRVARAERVQALVVGKSLMTPEYTDQAHAAGLQVVAFGGRSRATVRRLLSCRPDAIQTDNVPAMRELMPKPAPASVTGVYTK